MLLGADPLAAAAPVQALADLARAETAIPLGVRLLEYAAATALIGAATFRIFLLPGAGLMPTVHNRVSTGLRRFTLLALVLLMGALALRLWLQFPRSAGDPAALTRLGSLLTTQAWGQGWLVQALACVLAGIGAATGLTPLLALAALLLPAGLALQAHAAGILPLRALAITADAVHVLAAGAWIGTLAVLLLAVMPILFRGGIERGGHDTARVLDSFSPVAAAAVVLLAAAGATSAALRFHSITELATTPYGQTLLLKLAFVILTLVSGWHWGRARPALPLHTGVRALRRGAGLQLLFGAAALAASAALGALPIP